MNKIDEDLKVIKNSKQIISQMNDDIKSCVLSLLLRDRGFKLGAWKFNIINSEDGGVLVVRNGYTNGSIRFTCDGRFYFNNGDLDE